jgi:galactokinase
MSKSTFTVRAPGRVSVMGGHVDYNGGPVLPMAIPLQIDLQVEPHSQKTVDLYAEEIHQSAQFSLDDLQHQCSWIDYVQGVAVELKALGIPLHGFRGTIKSTLPMAAGLSSSAALEVATALAFLHLAEETLSPVEIALLCQRAENKFVGVQCGILDQTAIAACIENHALMLYCNTMEMEQIPFDLKDHSMIVTYSGAPRELASSAYNDRRASCEKAVEILQKKLPQINQLCDLNPNDLPLAEKVLSPLLYKRVRHVVTEIDRTKRAAVALKNNDLETLGRLIDETHNSLRDDYEVSSKELNWLVDWARKQPGVLGSRLTGAGFGGCTVTLMEKEYIATFMKSLPVEYKQFSGIDAECWEVTAVDGARVL